MTEDRTDLADARQGQVWTGPDGRPMIFVRTEDRPGHDGPQHLFIATRDRVVLERWHAADVPFPERLELKLDPEATRRARELEWELLIARRERDALVATMKAAVGLVPITVANELRRVYREAVGGLLRGQS